MKISVIIPTYKPGEYLWECLDSLCGQTFPANDFEILLILNGCREPFFSRISNYIAKRGMRNIRFLQTDQPGVSNARNIGLDIARGEYIAFMDDDDYVSPSYLEELYAKVSPDTVALCYPYAFKDGHPETQLPYAVTRAYGYCLRRGKTSDIASPVRKYLSGPCMKLIPRSFIQDRRFDLRFRNNEDALFMFLISDRFRYFEVTSRRAVYYRRFRQGSAVTTRRSIRKRLRDSLRFISAVSAVYFRHRGEYDFLFYATRVLGSLKGIVRG